jgi:hypothetical protein
MRKVFILKVEPLFGFGMKGEKVFEFSSFKSAQEAARKFAARGYIGEILQGGEIIYSTL